MKKRKRQYIIDGDPVAQEPKRVGLSGKSWDPMRKYKDKCLEELRTQHQKEPFSGLIYLSVMFYMPIPEKCDTPHRRQYFNNTHHVGRPKLHDLTGFVEEVVRRAICTKSSCIDRIEASKIYSDNPHTVINVIELDRDDYKIESSPVKEKLTLQVYRRNNPHENLDVPSAQLLELVADEALEYIKDNKETLSLSDFLIKHHITPKTWNGWVRKYRIINTTNQDILDILSSRIAKKVKNNQMNPNYVKFLSKDLRPKVEFKL